MFIMRPKLQKQSALRLAGRIIPAIMLDRFDIFVKERKQKLDFIIIIAKKEDTNGL